MSETRDTRAMDTTMSLAYRQLATRGMALLVAGIAAGLMAIVAVLGPMRTVDTLTRLQRLAYFGVITITGVPVALFDVGACPDVRVCDRPLGGPDHGSLRGLSWRRFSGGQLPRSVRFLHTDIRVWKGSLILRRDIVYAHVSGHYVEMVTTSGRAVVDSRIADVAEAIHGQEMQTHRSYWAAYRHIRRIRSDGHRVLLHLTGGRKVPAGRSFRSSVRAYLKRRPAP